MTAKHVLLALSNIRPDRRARVLAVGPCGARPSVVWRQDGEWTDEDWWTSGFQNMTTESLKLNDVTPALALRWNGERSVLSRARLLDVLTRGRPEGQPSKGPEARGPDTHRIPDFYHYDGKWWLELPENQRTHSHTFGYWVVDSEDSDVALATVAVIRGYGNLVEIP